ncbi:hypothetical protein ACPV5V_15890 [Vibrio campbellii]
MVKENVKKLYLNIHGRFSDESWIEYADSYPKFEELVPDSVFSVCLTALECEGKFWLSSDDVYTEGLRYKNRTGKRNILLDSGNATRFTREKHNDLVATKVPNLIISQMVPFLRAEEVKILTNPKKVKDPETNRVINVYPLSIMQIVARSYDFALRLNEVKGDIRLTETQKIRAIFLNKITTELTEDSLYARCMAASSSLYMTLPERQYKAVARPLEDIRDRGRAFDDEDWSFATWLCGIPFNPSDPQRFKSAVFASKIIAKMAYSFLDERTLQEIRKNKKRGLALHACLNEFGCGAARMVIKRLSAVGKRLYTSGSYKQFLIELEENGRDLILDDQGNSELAIKLNQLVMEGGESEYYSVPASGNCLL